MMRFLLNLVLAFSFLTNWLANAYGHQPHADQPMGRHDTVVMDHAAMSHASHQATMAMQPTSADDEAPVESASRCGDDGCQCGCTLPTVVVAPSFTVFPQSTASAPFVAQV